MTSSHANNVLVLGATGGIGGEVGRSLLKRGWAVRAMTRNPTAAAAAQPEFEWVKGDALNPADVRMAAAGARVIVHAVNPPGYADWGKLVLPMLDNTIAAAKSVGATIVLPGTIYNFGPDAFPVLAESSPQNPATVKGAIRVEMERRLKQATTEGIRAIILRAGDFFGPSAGNNWFSQGMVSPGQKLTSITYPGRPGIGHQWAYLPDVAEIMVRLIEKHDTIPAFATYHMEGFWDPDGTAMTEAIRRVAGDRTLTIKRFPWWMVSILWPFVPFFREVREMRYLWQQPLRMPNAHLVATIGPEPATPIDTALQITLSALGCLPKQV